MMKYLQILALGIAGGSIYLMPYIRYVFYDWQIEAMGITNAQLGLLLCFVSREILNFFP
jgi:hypothetical protein